jgi:F-type H+-transporting ATPase subunit a
MASKFGKIIGALSLSLLFTFVSIHANAAENNDGKLNISEEVFGHIQDSYEWHIFSAGNFDAAIPLPVMLYSPTNGFSFFWSSHFNHGQSEYNGYKIGEDGHIAATDGSKVYDFSITKNVAAMLIAVALLLVMFIGITKKYRQNGSNKAPSGFQNALEACILFVRDEVAVPNLGKNYKRFMPLLLTLFFFIWLGNLLGLIPGGANLTGNIAVTCCLATIAFVVMLFTSKKGFWAHTLNPHGVPLPVKFILVPIEIISLFIKPIALMIRLFANMLAGHVVIACFILLIFIFAALNKYIGGAFTIVSVGLAIFSMLIETLITAIQAYIFIILVSVFIGQMTDDGHVQEAVEI